MSYYYGSLVIQLSHDPNIIGVQFQWVNWMTASWMGGGPFCKVPNIEHCRHSTILLSVLLNLLCPVHTYRLTIWKVCFVLTLITMIIITMIHTVTFHVCHLWIKPVALGKSGANTGRAFEKVDGRVCVWSRPGERFAWPACRTGLNPIGQLWDQLGRAVRVSHHRHHAWSPSDCGIWVECYTTAACSAAHIQHEAVLRVYCCSIWWFYPLLML